MDTTTESAAENDTFEEDADDVTSSVTIMIMTELKSMLVLDRTKDEASHRDEIAKVTLMCESHIVRRSSA